MISKDYEKYKFLNAYSFVISDLDTTLTTKKSKYESRVFSIIMAGISIGIFAYVITVTSIMETTGAHPGVIALIYLVATVMIVWRIVATVQYHIDDTIRERTTNGTGNVRFDLSNAWRITSGGIQEDIDIGLGRKNGTVVVNYDTKAVFIKGIMRGTVDGADGDDLQHYTVLQQLFDLCFKNGYEVIRLNMPYNTDNDPIWDVETERIYKASSLGDEYLKLRTQLHETVYDFTKKNSTVTVNYFVIKATAAARIEPHLMAAEIVKLRKHCLMELSGIGMQEMKTLMEEYYGVIISVEDILSFMTMTSTSLGECKIISYTLPDGDVIKQNDIFEYQLPSIFMTGELANSYSYVPEGEPVEPPPEPHPVTLVKDIFSRDYI